MRTGEHDTEIVVNQNTGGFIGQLLASFFSTKPNPQREVWIRDITGLMLSVILAATVLILCGILAGFFTFFDTLPIYFLLTLSIAARFSAARSAWGVAGFLPVLMCFSLGAYGSIVSGYSSILVIFYALSVILAGMLIHNLSGFLMVVVCEIAFIGLGYVNSGFELVDLAQIITFTFGLIGIATLRWYSHHHLQASLDSQMHANQLLSAEIRQREEAEALLREQSTQLRRFADNTTDVITEMDPQGLIRYASPSNQSVLGYDPHALLGTNAFLMVHPDDVQAAKTVASEVFRKRQPDRIQVRIRRADERYVWMEISGSPLYDRNGDPNGFILASRDINAQKIAEQTIYESEKKFRTIIESLPLGIHMYRLDEQQRLIFTGYNPAAEKILGVDHSQYVGKTIETNFPGLIEPGITRRFAEIARVGSSWNSADVEYSEAPIIQGHFEVHAFQTEPGSMVSVFTDISERIRSTEALQLSEEKFSTAFLTSPDSVNINRLVDGVYIDINQGFTRLMGYTRDEVLGKSSLDLNIWVDAQDRGTLVKGLLENGVIENLEARFRRKNGDIGIGLMSARIILIQGEKCILSITRDISSWIRAQIDLREAHAQLQMAYEATLQGWANALELRERETADHSRRVVKQTLEIARRMSIPEHELDHIRRGALLHDIGKLGVPDAILLKPATLTPDEWAIMAQHPIYAREMLQGIEYLFTSMAIPYCHHEKWDGSGYPCGLKGEEIPLEARIFAVIDVWDALTSDRPYRKAWPKEKALSYIKDQAGKQFDPMVVEHFFNILD